MKVFKYLLVYSVAGSRCDEFTSVVSFSKEKCVGSTLHLTVTVVNGTHQFAEPVALECPLQVDSGQYGGVHVVGSARSSRFQQGRERIKCRERSKVGNEFLWRVWGSLVPTDSCEVTCDGVVAYLESSRKLELTLHSNDAEVRVTRDAGSLVARTTVCGISSKGRRELASGNSASRYGSFVNCQDEQCPERWDECYNTTEWAKRGALPQVLMAVFLQSGFVSRYPSQEDCVLDVIGMVADSNERIFVPQLGLYIKLDLIVLPDASRQIIKTGLPTDDCRWNSNNSIITIKEMLDEFVRVVSDTPRFKAVTTRETSDFGLFHLLTDCYTLESEISYESLHVDPTTVGLAHLGNGHLCSALGRRSAVTTFDRHGRTWKTMAHEIGHNLGAHHSFKEEGKGNIVEHYGGIMDYGNGKINGIYQFNSRRKKQICKRLQTLLGTGATLSSTCVSDHFNGKDNEFRWVILPSDVTTYPAECTSAPLRIARTVTCVHARTGSWAEDFNCDPAQRPISMIVNLWPVRCPRTTASCGNNVVDPDEECDNTDDSCCVECKWKRSTQCDFYKITGAFVLLDSLFLVSDGASVRYTPIPKIEHLSSTYPDAHWPKKLSTVIPRASLFDKYLAAFSTRNGDIYFFGMLDNVLQYIMFDHFYQRVVTPVPLKFADDFDFECTDMKYAYYTIEKYPIVKEKAFFRCKTQVIEYTFNGRPSEATGSHEIVTSTDQLDQFPDAVAMVRIPEIWEVWQGNDTGKLYPAQIWTFLSNGRVQRRFEANAPDKTVPGPRAERKMKEGRRRCSNSAFSHCKVCTNGGCAQCDHGMIWIAASKKCSRLLPATVADFSKNPVIGAKIGYHDAKEVARLFPFKLSDQHGVTKMVSGRCTYKRELEYKGVSEKEVDKARGVLEDVAHVLREIFATKYERVSMDKLEVTNYRVKIRYTLVLLDGCESDELKLEGNDFFQKLDEETTFKGSKGSGTPTVNSVSKNSDDKSWKMTKNQPVTLEQWVPQGSRTNMENWQFNIWLLVESATTANVFRIDDTVALFAEIKNSGVRLSLTVGPHTLKHTFVGEKFLGTWIQIAVRVNEQQITLLVDDYEPHEKSFSDILPIKAARVEIGPSKQMMKLVTTTETADGMDAYVSHVVLFRIINGSPYDVSSIPLLPAITAGVFGAIVTIFAFVNLFGYQLVPPKIE